MNAMEQAQRIKQAMAVLQDNKAPAESALALMAGITAASPLYRQAQHLRGIVAFRTGDSTRAVQLLVDAIRLGEPSVQVFYNLARASSRCGNPPDALAAIDDCIRGRLEDKFAEPFVHHVAEHLGFVAKAPLAYLEDLFERFFLPLAAWACANRRMELASGVERVIYEGYVKAQETEAHFVRCMERMTPHYQRLGEHWRSVLPPMPVPPQTRPYKVGFFIHSASMLAHIEVLLHTLRGYRLLDEQPFAPVIYCFSSRNPEMERALAELDIPIVFLSELNDEARLHTWPRLLALREIIIRDGVHELVWVSLYSLMPLAFSARMAPVQTFFAMKYRNISLDGIDGYVTGSALTRFGTIAGRRWRMGMLGVDNWYDPSQEEEARAIRASLGDCTVVATLARTEKMVDPGYLAALVRLLQENPEVIFLWAGREQHPDIVRALKQGGVLQNTRFIGWVNTRLYAQVPDVFIDTFPFPCGFTLYQAMAAGKPVVVSASPEAAQTGLWNFLRPLFDGDEGTPEERGELMGITGTEDQPLIALARSANDFVAHANRLIRDAACRRAAGEASRRLMARYFSDPRVMGASFSRHFVELVDHYYSTLPVQPAT